MHLKYIYYFISTLEAADFPTNILPTVIASGKEAGVLRYASISHKMSAITNLVTRIFIKIVENKL